MGRRYYPPLLLGLLVVALWLAQSLHALPPTSVFAAQIVDRLAGAGRWVVVVVACLENTIGVNSYFPGAIPLLMLAATATNLTQIIIFVILIYCGQMLGLVISFAAGSLLAPSEKVRRPLGWRIWLGFPLFAHPQSATATVFLWGGAFRWESLLVVAACCLVWSVFWGGFVYLGGAILIQEVGWDYVTFAVCLGWICWLVVKDLRARHVLFGSSFQMGDHIECRTDERTAFIGSTFDISSTGMMPRRPRR